jgi:hypothetical protein
LLNTVLDTLSTYDMGALEMPSALLHAIEALRCAFIWNCVDHMTSVKCLVAWSDVCWPKSEGGLGIRLLMMKNKCTQMKLLHRDHDRLDAPWMGGSGRMKGGIRRAAII